MTKNSQPLVTIAIPTYNRADSYLKQALESAVNQTYQNIEIIVSDNCSTDNTEAVVKGFSDPRIRYFRQARNIGANNNFNFCLEQARGAYFLLFQDDDLIDADFIDVCMKGANYDTDVGIIRAGIRRIDSHGNVLSESPNLVGGLSTEEFFLAWFAGKTPMHLCSTLFNTERLREIGGFNSKHQLFQDVLAEVQLAARFGRVDVEDIKASFRKHASQTSVSSKVSSWCEDSLLLLDAMCDLVSDGKKELVRSEGKKFFTGHNYRIARTIESPVDRFFAYLIVLKNFGYPVNFFISRIPVIRRARRISRRMRVSRG